MAIGQSGFNATRSLTGKRPVTKIFPVATAVALYRNDPVELDANGQVIPCTAASVPVGVVTDVFKDVNGQIRPLTFNQPDNGPFLSATQLGYASVNVDPEQRYEVHIDVSASAGLIGSNVTVSAGTANDRAGISGYSLSGTVATSAGAGQARIVGLAPRELIDGRGDKASGSAVEVVLYRTAFTQDAGT